MNITVYAPASIGNLSVGFDLLGAAIAPIDGSLLGDRVHITSSNEAFSLTVTGRFAEKLPKKAEDNIVYACYLLFKQQMLAEGVELMPLALTLEKNLPIGSGLGSSASSIVAALVALNHYHGKLFSETQLLQMMGQLEGQISGSVHYDNVAPSFLGGLQLMLEQADFVCQTLPCFSQWYWVMSYPGIAISTSQARDILPANYSRQDVINQNRYLAGFIHSCYSDQPALAARMLVDVIAEPYRQALLPNFAAIREQSIAAGALALGISGSGSTIFTLCDSFDVAESVAALQQQQYVQNDNGFVHICQLSNDGAVITTK